LENVMRLGEVDNMGDLEKYGYKYFTIEKVST
jgi:serine protease inhibitor ecotin